MEHLCSLYRRGSPTKKIRSSNTTIYQNRIPNKSIPKTEHLGFARHLDKISHLSSQWYDVFSPHHCGVFVFFLASRPSPVPPSASASRLPKTILISHHSSHNYSSHTTHLTTTHLTQLISHTTHLTQLISHTTHLNLTTTHLTQLISHTTHLTQLISHTTHLTQHSSHTHTHTHTSQNVSHTQRISHTSSHTSHHTPLISHTHTHHKTYLIIHKSSHIIHNSSHTQLILHTTHLTDSAWQAQYTGADCRRLGRGFSLRGRRNTQGLPKQLRRGLSPAGPRLLFAWQAQYTEAPEGAGARIVAGWAAASLCVGRSSPLRTRSLLKELGRGLSPAGLRLLSAWQAQYTEPSEGAAARIVAGWAAALLCVAGAVHRGSWRSWGADCRRLGRGSPLRGRRSTQSLLKELGRGLSPAGPRLSFAWQAQYTEPSEGAAARIVAGWAAALLCVAGAVHRASRRSCGADCRRLGRGWLAAAVILSFAEEVSVWQICVAAVSPQLYWRLQRRCLCDRSVSPPLYWRLQRRCLCDRSVLPQLYWRLQRRCLCDRPASPQLYWRFSHNSSHTAHPTPLISHPSSHTTHLTPLISHHSSHTTHPTPLVHTTHLTPLISHHSSHTNHLTPFISHHSSHTAHLTPLISHPSSHTTHLTPLISHHSSHTTHLTPLIPHHDLTPLISHHSSHTTHLTPLIPHH